MGEESESTDALAELLSTILIVTVENVGIWIFLNCCTVSAVQTYAALKVIHVC